VVGRFAHFAPAVWLYSMNMAALAAIGYRLVVLLPDVADDAHTLDRKVSLSLMIGTSVLCVGVSVISPAKALWVFVLNLAEPQLARWFVTRASHDG
jgi:membrane-anchored glycerophosphoryl diester phosphodiesterase (GDPDase)